MKNLFRRISVLAAGLAVLSACHGESPSAPLARPADAASASLIGDLLGGLTLVSGLQRTSPLSSSITVSQTIGGAGGTLNIPQAGVTVVVPTGALIAPTVITMTARAGSLVAYDFAPHGIVFAKPLTITQKLSGTNATPLTAPLIQLGYYSDPSLLGSTVAIVSELLGGSVNLLSWSFTSSIPHFSGYVLTSGRGGSVD